MKKIIKRGACVTLIYLVAIACTFMLSNRIERLEASSAYQVESVNLAK